jgi:hypothetical protein
MVLAGNSMKQKQKFSNNLNYDDWRGRNYNFILPELHS